MQPVIAVGICTMPQIDFNLEGIFSAPGADVVTAQQRAVISQSGLAIEWNGLTVTSVEFTPTSPGDSFEIDGVTIGVRFHWERTERQRFRGSLRLIVEHGKITAVNIVDVEEYLKSVISSEMSAEASPALLKAHAVISRGWVLSQIEGRHAPEAAPVIVRDKAGERIRWWDRSNHENFDVCADDHCQRYQGIQRISSPAAIGAVDDTRGEVLTYSGKICDTRFSKCCGGMMELFGTCWDDESHPYLRALRDTVEEQTTPDLTDEQTAREWILSRPESFCNTSNERILSHVLNNYDRETTDFYRWRVEYSADQLSSLIESKLQAGLGTVTALEPISRGPSGRIYRLKISGTNGSLIIGKELEIRRALSPTHLYSSAFVVDREGDRFIITGAGWGHGVGLCQIGAAVMADSGYDYRTILSHYYKDAKLEKLY